MTRSLARRLLERDRADPRCGSCGDRQAGGLCDRCRAQLEEELEAEDAEWWPEPEYPEPGVPAGEWDGQWDDDWDDDDLPF